MVDVLVVGTRDLFVDLLTVGLQERGFDTEIVDPASAALSVTQSRPPLCLFDQRVPPRDESLELIAEAVDAGEGRTRVVVLSCAGDEETVRTAHAAGADGFVRTSASVEGLVSVLESVRSGQTGLCLPRPRRSESVLGTDLPRLASMLTRRERECLRLLVDGVSTRQIALTLAISELTVRGHVQQLLHKLGAHSRLEVVSLAIRYALLDKAPQVVRVG